MLFSFPRVPRAMAAVALVAAAAVQAADQPLTELPYTPGLDVRSMDTSASPCEDFYQYACGGWMKNNPIPPDQARWDVYAKLADENKRFLWGLLDGLSKQAEGRSVPQQQIGDLFASCMNEARVDEAGAKPLTPWLDRIQGLKSVGDVPALLAALHLATANGGLFFNLDQGQDFSDSTRVIAFVGAGGLSLPDRDYYLQNDARMRAIRADYLTHVARMMELAGSAPEAARREAAVVLQIETALARPQLTRVQQRDPHMLHHKMDRRALQRLTPRFAWDSYLGELGLGDVREFNVNEPAFLKALDQQLRTRSLADIKSYLRWHLVHAMAPQLAAPFFQENFAFFGKALRGIPEPSPRWRQCVTLVDHELGDALGQEFVRRTFSPEQKQKTERMTRQIEDAMAAEIKSLDWMSAPTKEKALEKLSTIVNKIGYPDRWRDYGAVRIARDDLAGNVERTTQFEVRRQLAKIGKPLDRGEWGMTPPTVNAYYNAQMNDINFPAGVLQPPLFDPKMDDGPNYGNTGGTIGHELTHGFDDEGRQFDAQGNLKNWWATKDEKAFNERTKCLTDQYATYTIVDDIKINSKLTLGEDLADLGGLVLALIAWKTEMAGQPMNTEREGFTPIQRFFIGFAQWACENARPEELRINAKIEPHSPGRYRVNGLVVNMPEFEQAFSCKPGQPMAPVKRCRVW
ncbi:M13 family metallopeptidase [Ideonella sp. DXS29W]|uniref:M13 family metallopeptidase n=1 Tax=Ideonella lacteola TaxID=2984193 RepID=A0ABU9BGY3_9BURK